MFPIAFYLILSVSLVCKKGIITLYNCRKAPVTLIQLKKAEIEQKWSFAATICGQNLLFLQPKSVTGAFQQVHSVIIPF